MDVCGFGLDESCDLSEFLRPHPGIMHNNVQPNLPSTNTEGFQEEKIEEKMEEKMEEEQNEEQPIPTVHDVLKKKPYIETTRNGDIRIDITRTKSVIITEFKGGLHAYIWKKERGRPTVKDLKALFKKKEIITDAIMTILIAGEYDL